MANKKPQTRTQRRAKTIDDFPTIDEIIEKDINDKTETEFPVKKVIQFIPILIIIILLFVAGSANSKYNKMKTEINGYKTKIVNLTDKKNEYEELIESYKKASIEANKTITEQSDKIENLEESNTKYKQQVKTLNSKVDTLTKNNKTLIAEVKNLKDTNGSLNDQIKVLKNKNEYANIQIIDLTKQTEKDKDTITNLNNKVTTLNNKLTTANNNITTLTTTNTELNTKLTKLEEQFSSINTYKIVNSEMDLIEAAKTGGNILLNTNIIMSSDLELNNKYMTIDLRGYNLVTTSINLTDTILEVKDSSLTQTGKVSLVGDNDDFVRGFKVNTNSTLKITNGNYEGKNLIQVIEEGNLFIVGGKFENKQEEIINATENAKIEVLGGTFKE